MKQSQRLLLTWLIEDTRLFELIEEYLGAEDFTEDIYQKTAQILFEQYHRDGKVNPAQIINLFRHLQEEHGFSFLFIAHDLAVVEFLCDRIGVLYHGRLVELAPTASLFAAPQHPYTRALLSSIPIPDPRLERARRPLVFEGPLPDGGTWTEVAPEHYVLLEGGGAV